MVQIQPCSSKALISQINMNNGTLDRDGLEDVEPVQRSGRQHPWHLWMPMQFFTVTNTMMAEEQLRRNISQPFTCSLLNLIIVLFH